MLKIRLQRTGAKNQPHYRLVVTDVRFKRDGKFIEILGSYHPAGNYPFIKIYEKKIVKYLKNGAQMSETVRKILRKTKTLHKLFELKKGIETNFEDVCEIKIEKKQKSGENLE